MLPRLVAYFLLPSTFEVLKTPLRSIPAIAPLARRACGASHPPSRDGVHGCAARQLARRTEANTQQTTHKTTTKHAPPTHTPLSPQRRHAALPALPPARRQLVRRAVRPRHAPGGASLPPHARRLLHRALLRPEARARPRLPAAAGLALGRRGPRRRLAQALGRRRVGQPRRARRHPLPPP